ASEPAVPPPLVAPRLDLPMRPIGTASGVLSPHIDFARGGSLYAGTWTAALPAVASAEVVVIFGTDHAGSAGRLTPTRQHYSTPWGPLPTDLNAVDAVAAALGEADAFDEELHHRREHSIELAAVWLHWALRCSGRSAATMPAMIPILCGSFYPYVQRGADGARGSPLPEAQTHLAAALTALQRAIGKRRALVVSAADLAHVGPAFGDRTPLDDDAKRRLARGDDRVLEGALSGSADAFLDALRVAEDRTRVCGLPPTYWALRLLQHLTANPVFGRLVGYRQCPADSTFGSVVSIAGVLWEAELVAGHFSVTRPAARRSAPGSV
ncbi:MAG: AmmeMemoRadiSam system protein B, partial [Chloroflexota bacterium]|nr:AmmeMemoRadiSam system protein B [Chloroflexota bacterium]